MLINIANLQRNAEFYCISKMELAINISIVLLYLVVVVLVIKRYLFLRMHIPVIMQHIVLQVKLHFLMQHRQILYAEFHSLVALLLLIATKPYPLGLAHRQPKE